MFCKVKMNNEVYFQNTLSLVYWKSTMISKDPPVSTSISRATASPLLLPSVPAIRYNPSDVIGECASPAGVPTVSTAASVD